jgi:hypothetical protein
LRPLTDDEALMILTAGGIEINNNSEDFRNLARALEEVREDFLNELEWRRLSMTDFQLASRLTQVRNGARQLLMLLADFSLWAQAMCLEEEPRRISIAPRGCEISNTYVPKIVHHGEREAELDTRVWLEPLKAIEAELDTRVWLEPLKAINGWADARLATLKRRQKSEPNWGGTQSASAAGVKELAVGLATVWRMATGNEEPSCARGSSMIPFLCKGMEIIRQRKISDETARKWASYAVKYYFAE